MKRGTLIALGLTVGTVALVASRRRKDEAGEKGGAKDATESAPADQATPDTAKAPPPFRESDLSSEQPWNRITPKLSPYEKQVLQRYIQLYETDPNVADPDELIDHVLLLRQFGYGINADYLKGRADLARDLRSYREIRAIAITMYPPSPTQLVFKNPGEGETLDSPKVNGKPALPTLDLTVMLDLAGRLEGFQYQGEADHLRYDAAVYKRGLDGGGYPR